VTSGTFAAAAPSLWEAGISAIPTILGQKRPAEGDWSRYCHTLPTPEERHAMLQDRGHCGVGAALGAASGLVAVDKDSEDPRVTAALDSLLPATPYVRVGKKGAAYLFRFSGQKTARIKEIGAAKPLVEILSAGTQVMLPPSIHPETMRPYTASADLAAVKHLLPELPPDFEARLRAELKAAGFNVEVKAEAPPPAPRTQRRAPRASGETRLPDAELIAENCGVVGRWRADPAGVSYPEWVELGAIVSKCADGLAGFQEWSEGHPGYGAGEAARKYGQVEALKPPRCGTIAGPECDRCPFKGVVNSPIALGYGDPNLLPLQAAHVLDAERRTFVSVETGECLSRNSFDDRYGHLVPKGTPYAAFVRDRRSPRAAKTDYRPDRPELMIREGGEVLVNLYRPGGVAPAETADCPTILAHLEYLIPVAEEREHFLDILAHVAQHPGVKIKYAALLIGPEGNGKSFVVENLPRILVGDRNFQVVSGGLLDTRFSYGLGNCQVLTIDEVMQYGKPEVANNLKPWITQDKVKAEAKGVDAAYARTPYAVFITSNYDVPLFMSDGDRRYYVIRTNETKLPDEYYENLFTKGLAEAPAFKRHLLNRDLSGFRAGAKAPMTGAKRDAIAGSRLPLADEIAVMMEQGALARAVMTFGELRGALEFRDAIRRGQTGDRTISTALKSVGWWTQGTPVRLDGKPQRVWVHPEHVEALKGASPAVLARVWGEGKPKLKSVI
jgi:hypothetical protein